MYVYVCVKELLTDVHRPYVMSQDLEAMYRLLVCTFIFLLVFSVSGALLRCLDATVTTLVPPHDALTLVSLYERLACRILILNFDGRSLEKSGILLESDFFFYSRRACLTVLKLSGYYIYHMVGH